ncbi:MAG TPA: hypothetical protein VG650_07475 [Mycobacteriales bacterium]|nr:hypothetical protein [Mycobacteriales bacterium]
MPTRRTTAAPPALTDEDVTALRAKVAAGEKPRVVIRAASAAVAAGTRGNVIRVGDPKDGEYVVVRLGKDEVPFAPNELGIPGRAPATPAAAPKTAPAAPKTAQSPAPRASKTAQPRRAPSRPAKRVPPLAVTLRFKEGGWTIEAQRGARRLARPTPMRPGAVSALTEHLDDDALRDALVETVESCRSVVEAQRAELKSKLEAAEAALRDYDARPRRR